MRNLTTHAPRLHHLTLAILIAVAALLIARGVAFGATNAPEQAEDRAPRGAGQTQLEVLKSGPAYVAPGEPFSYTIFISDAAGVGSDGVILSDILPPELEYVGPVSTNSPTGACTRGETASGQTEVTCGELTVPPAGDTTVTFLVVVPESDAPPATVVNTVTVRDAFSADTSTLVTTVIEGTDIDVEKTGPQFVVRDSTFRYAITIVDLAEIGSSEVDVLDNFDSDLTLDLDSIKVDNGTGDCSQSTPSQLVCTDVTVPAQGEVVIYVDVLLDINATPGELENTVQVADYDEDNFILLSTDEDTFVNTVLAAGARHVDRFGTVEDDADDSNNLIGALHEFCIFGIDADTINGGAPLPSSAWVIEPLNGSGADLDGDGEVDSGPAVVSSIVTFSADVNGNGTEEECARWTSFTPGEQTVAVQIAANLLDSPEDACGQPTAERGAPGGNIVIDFFGCLDGDDDRPFQPLIKEWNVLLRTEIQPVTDESNVDGQTIEVPALQNPLTGEFFFAEVGLQEVIFAHHQTATGIPVVVQPDGAVVTFIASGTCGVLFVTDPDDRTGATEIVVQRGDSATVVSAGAPIPFSVELEGCMNARGSLTVTIYVTYPAQVASVMPLPEIETVTVALVPQPQRVKVPALAWAGQRVTVFTDYTSGGRCAVDELLEGGYGDYEVYARYTRTSGPGGFIGNEVDYVTGLPNLVDQAVVRLDGCLSHATYESEDPGQIDIEIELVIVDREGFVIYGASASKLAQPIFYLKFEDLTLSGGGTANVATTQRVTASVRGWFVNSNPSGRPEEVVTDGFGFEHTVPANRWVLPDDWDALAGGSLDEFREPWPDSAPMPPAMITFWMPNESIENYYPGEMDGSSGYFQVACEEVDLDGDGDSDVCVPYPPIFPDQFPISGVHSALGDELHPRIWTVFSDINGNASADIYGDFNLSFEECEPNPLTGNPHCAPGDIVGRTNLVATADYPDFRKHPQVSSNLHDIAWDWAGFKEVTIERVGPDGELLPDTMRYVVLHLLDRAGTCEYERPLAEAQIPGFENEGNDIYTPHSVLGEQVDWLIDNDQGIILDGEFLTYIEPETHRAAITLTFDTENNEQGDFPPVRPVGVIDEDEECQSWILVENSLRTATNVLVTAHDPEGDIAFDVIVNFEDIEATASIDVQKQANPPVVYAGSEVVFTFTVTNDGALPLRDIVLTDSALGVVEGCAAELEPDASSVCSVSVTAGEDGETNTVTATAVGYDPNVPDASVEVSDSATAGYEVTTLDLEFEKTGPEAALSGEEVTYQFTLTNTGGALNNVRVEDEMLGGVIEECSRDRLEAGGQVSCSATYTIPADFTGELTNVAFAVGTDDIGGEINVSTAHTIEVSAPELDLFQGWNEVYWLGVDLVSSISDRLDAAFTADTWTTVARYDNASGQWLQRFRSAPLESLNTLHSLEAGKVYWIFASDDTTLIYPLK